MTLTAHIKARIAAQGPMRIDEYMTTCLLHPTMGYYTTRDPFGAAGDFITAPEISQMFGEVLGLCIAQTWLDQGAPTPFTLAELGPGRGTLMADALRACRNVPGFIEAAEITLVEASPTLRAIQTETLAGHRVTFADDLEALPEQPLFLIANEFFDALPIRQFLRDGSGWRERQVGLHDGSLTFGLAPAQAQPALTARLDTTQDGDLIESCAAIAPVMDTIAARIAAHGGVALIVDYGGWQHTGDTLQALRDHQKVPPLGTPGDADLTAHVDFAALAQAGASCAHSALTPQGVFLERLGITQRAQNLATKLTGAALETHIAAHHRLTHPEEMGNLFKVMALYPQGSAPPPGVDP
ncbi:class I SAM-dependent methyltransferase [Sulfitobacter sp. M57]|uniref:class I SAM-dependent methyltransferase n=1 Tax=unclassified Sulfitobacter TaxID=196795 RepID=UPI0023E0DD02|nr:MULTISPECIES: SAM-dependent methyltransferase [unclassified Sulfitobacter]MDF3415635.1 class I SAM-dependent methyltransferase [Sulfitobacter sp. KE5]MDF3423115.1 class I SAM-dependent methyltransferase [Sulfitobacter sp. KE43]MDF3434181.1 class I SAM-dependent methyltransferase [Sulfitobacter sp. KE42]MDF3459786.1 class I SAM-dependent methyltransferase [Sulfitobacter sp. S74]MDF3463719.1 class I SAM-dependent methyltransferase [Sulfitobacter sp. Ks18]